MAIRARKLYRSLQQLEQEETDSKMAWKRKVNEVQIMREQYESIKAALFKEIEKK